MAEKGKNRNSHTGICAGCGGAGRKRDMPAIMIRANSYKPIRTLCHLCERCLLKLLDELEVEMPD